METSSRQPRSARNDLVHDSRYLASGGTDGKAGLWTAAGGPVGGTLIDPTKSGGNWVHVGFADNGTTLVTLLEIRPPVLWDIDPNRLAERACAVDLGPAEWQAVLPDRPYQQSCPGLG